MVNRSHKVVDVEDTSEPLFNLKMDVYIKLCACNAYPINAPIQIEM